MIGTVVGAVAIVLLAVCFPQDRVPFLTGLALWGGVCAFAATVLRNFAGYAAALSGYTAAIIAGDQLGPTGGVNGDVFMLAVIRVSEIAIGIVSRGRRSCRYRSRRGAAPAGDAVCGPDGRDRGGCHRARWRWPGPNFPTRNRSGATSSVVSSPSIR